MLQRMKVAFRSVRDWVNARAAGFGGTAAGAARVGATRTLSLFAGARGPLVVLGGLGIAGYVLYSHPPMENVGRGEVGVRANRLTGDVSEWRDGSVLVIPGIPTISERRSSSRRCRA